MVNNFRAAKRITQELEAETNAIPVKTQPAKQALYMCNKHLEAFMDWLGRAEKHELTQ